MPKINSDLHGMVPDESPVAVLLLDVINDLEFEGGEKLAQFAIPMADKIADLTRRAREAKIPVIYVNDNYGRWQSDFTKLIDRCLHEDVRGKPMVEKLLPGDNDYFVLKPKHSGFYSTTLDVLLDYIGARKLIIGGVAGNICVLFTANDAYMRDFEVYVPSDCVASNEQDDNDHALSEMATVLKADITPSDKLDLEALKQKKGDEDKGAKPRGEPQFPKKSAPNS